MPILATGGYISTCDFNGEYLRNQSYLVIELGAKGPFRTRQFILIGQHLLLFIKCEKEAKFHRMTNHLITVGLCLQFAC